MYEYAENGNLEQWLHGDVGRFGPLTWEIRMKIAVGTAKGLVLVHVYYPIASFLFQCSCYSVNRSCILCAFRK